MTWRDSRQVFPAVGEAVPVIIRSNPSLAKILFARRQTPLPKAAPLGADAEAVAEQAQTYAAPEKAGLHEPVAAETKGTADAAETNDTAAKGTGQGSSEDSGDSSESRADSR